MINNIKRFKKQSKHINDFNIDKVVNIKTNTTGRALRVHWRKQQVFVYLFKLAFT